MSTPDALTSDERAALAPYFSELDGDVFALTGLPEVVKGALFARYSRSSKSLRRLFADEFLEDLQGVAPQDALQSRRAEALYDKVFVEYGDDSVAQLGGVHLAVEGASNVLTKVLEWGRLMAYLEQSTRYIPYTDKPGGRYRYVVPPELDQHPALRERYVAVLDRTFDEYARMLDRMEAFWSEQYPREAGVSEGAWKRSVRAKALDTVRGLLPAATRSNVGLYGTGQAYEAMLLRMRAHPLAEVRECADQILVELRKVIPSFLKRVDQPERGVAWSRYLSATRDATRDVARRLLDGHAPAPRDEVVLTDFDPDGEVKVVAAALYAVSDLPDDQLLEVARRMSDAERREVLAAYVGERQNRRHKPGRAFERTTYRFDVLSDYGAFRDLQRHRLLTLEWQTLTTRHGYTMPEEIEAAGEADAWQRVMDDAAAICEAIEQAGLAADVAAYAVPMAYRVRYFMDMNAREAMHVIELRTAPQGHASYRRVCQQMHRLIAEGAGHRALADAMRFTDHSAVGLERLGAEQAAERRRQQRTQRDGR